MLFDFIKRFWFINPTIGFFVGGGSSSGGYSIAKSVRIRSGVNAHLNRLFVTPSGATQFTFSCWVKLGAIASDNPILGVAFDASNYFNLYHGGSSLNGALRIGYSISATPYNATTNALYRDPSAWLHIVYIADTNNATAGNRAQLYVNGVLQTFATNTLIQTVNLKANTATTHYLGRWGNTAGSLDGNLADVYFVDGQLKAATDFGVFNSEGVWVPKVYGGTYGNNGFHLDFKEVGLTTLGVNTGLGKDVSGFSREWVTNAISVSAGVNYDSMADTPTNNYATLNPIQPRGGNFATTLSDGALSYASAVGASFPRAYSTIPLAEAGSYFEFTCIAGDTAGPYFGISSSDTLQTPTSGGLGFGANEYGYQSSTGVFRNNNSTLATYATFTTGDVIAIAYKNGSLWIAKNNTWLNSGNPDSNTGAVATGLSTTTKWLAACATNNSGTKVAALNAGQQPWSTATSTARTTASTFGALCTANLPPVAIKEPASYFNAKTRVGTAGTYSVTGEAFPPDFVWVKSAGRALDHALYDSVRGVQNRLETNNTDAEVTGDSTGLTAFNSDGYTGGALDQINGTTATNRFIDWMWKAGGAPTTDNVALAGNTPTAGSVKIDGANLGSALAGTIAATRLSANTTAGFSVVTYTGTGANATIAHGLGVAPKMVITRCRNYGSARNWSVWHSGIANTEFLNLNDPGAKATDATMWNSTSPTTSVFSVGSNANSNLNTYNFVAYCFAEIAGYSKFGSYVGNNSADGPFVYCGFRPRFIMWKNVTGTGGWVIYDSARDTYNACNAGVKANLSGNEQATWGPIDILSNGFKFRAAVNADTNYSNYTYVFAAFAEHPFGGSNVAPSPAR